MACLATFPSIWGFGTQPHLYMGLGRVMTIQDKRSPRVEAKKAQGQPQSSGVEPFFSLCDPEQLTLSSEPQFPHM